MYNKYIYYINMGPTNYIGMTGLELQGMGIMALKRMDEKYK